MSVARAIRGRTWELLAIALVFVAAGIVTSLVLQWVLRVPGEWQAVYAGAGFFPGVLGLYLITEWRAARAARRWMGR